ncbi:cytochrome-c oxidase [Dongia rigui]|uniref:Cytochrome-c oxidase n=1 Tax=Dongia rigui TaxID=940149 RepID=A0ABU5DWD6_9PROT|nr:cytochrome-c oxidase [Dongia rigui]MDY0871622.1 cytochrome-c oxidase [Dongia rigui]
MAHRLLKIAAVYFVIAVCMGTYMGAAQDLSLVPVHAHLNLLGWVSLGIIGCLYLQKPALATTRLAKLHFWLHNIGTPLMMLGVWLLHSGVNPELGEPLAGIFSIVTVIGIIAFAVNLWRGIDRA